MAQVAVLLQRIQGHPDLPTRDYVDRLFTGAGRGTGNLVDYYLDMSHGLLDLSGTGVFGWMDYGHSLDEIADVFTNAKQAEKTRLIQAGSGEVSAEDQAWRHAHSLRRNTIKTWGLDAARSAGHDLTGYDVVVHVFNTQVDYFGGGGSCVLSWNPGENNHASMSMDLTGVSHEVGHALGLEAHSRREDTTADYTDMWDIMSAYNGVYLDNGGTQDPPNSDFYTYGPGLNAANMDIMGWLDRTRTFATSANSATVRLRPLHARHLPGYLVAKVQFGVETLFVEFRMNSRWDTKLPSPCVLLHRKTVNTASGWPCSELVVARTEDGATRYAMRQGDHHQIGDPADPLGFAARLTVTSIDAARLEATVQVSVRNRRQLEPRATPYGAVTSDGGGFVWVPGRGRVRIPPRSPLLPLLEHFVEAEIIAGLSPRGRVRDLNELSLGHLIQAHAELGSVIEARTAVHVPAPVTNDEHYGPIDFEPVEGPA